MKTKSVMLILALVVVSLNARAQLSGFASSKPMGMQSASALVNKSYQGESMIVEKSTASLNTPIAELMRRYDKTITISYQIASVNALERAIVRSRASDLLDSSFWDVLAAGQLSTVFALMADEYVTMSAYAPLTLKLNFNFIGKTRPYYHHPEDFARTNSGAPLHTKTMLIKK